MSSIFTQAAALLDRAKLLITQRRLARIETLKITLLRGFAVQSQMGTYQVDADVSGLAFEVLMNRDVLARLTPQLRKANSDERYAECRTEIAQIIRLKISAGEYAAGNKIHINLADTRDVL